MVSTSTLACLLILGLTCVGVAGAGQVTEAEVRHEGEWLVLDLQLAELLDASALSTVESGLPGSCLIEVELRDQSSDVIVIRRLERSLELDLWEDVVRLIEDGRELVFNSIAEADSAWSTWPARRMVQWASLSQDRTYHLRVAVHVQPLGSEERERVSRWVSESERNDRRDFSIDMGGLVRRFFGSGEDEVDVWRGQPFTLETVRVAGEEQK